MYALDFSAKTEDGTKVGVIYLRHEPIEADKITTLRAAMLTNGWEGRKVVMLDCGDHHMAFNGVHRLCAAQGIDDLVDVAWLPTDLTPEQWDEIEHANDDESLLAAFREIAEDRDDMDEAVEAMQAEVKANGY